MAGAGGGQALDLHEMMKEVKEALMSLKCEVSELRCEVSELRGEVSELRGEVSALARHRDAAPAERGGIRALVPPFSGQYGIVAPDETGGGSVGVEQPAPGGGQHAPGGGVEHDVTPAATSGDSVGGVEPALGGGVEHDVAPPVTGAGPEAAVAPAKGRWSKQVRIRARRIPTKGGTPASTRRTRLTYVTAAPVRRHT